MSASDGLIAVFARLPGIGRKTAQRLTYHLLDQPAEQVSKVAACLTTVVERVRPCGVCGNPTDADAVSRITVTSNPRGHPYMFTKNIEKLAKWPNGRKRPD